MNDSKLFWLLAGLALGWVVFGHRIRHVSVRVTDSTDSLPVTDSPLPVSVGTFPPLSSSCPGGCQ